MTGWPSAPLGSLCEVSIGKTPSRERSDFFGPGCPWLSIADMNQGRAIKTTRETITSRAVQEAKMKLVTPGTVVMSFKLTVGKVGIAQVPLYTNEAIAHLPIRDPSRLLPEYLCWALQSVDLSRTADRAAKGVTLNSAKLKEIRIPLPPLPEQRRIAAILDQADALRAMRRQLIAQLDTLAQSIFLDMFGDPVSNPRGFPLAQLGSLCDKVIDCPHSTPVYAGVLTPYACIRSSDIQGGELLLSEAKRVEEGEYVKRIARGAPQRGDVIYCREGARFGNAARITATTRSALGSA